MQPEQQKQEVGYTPFAALRSEQGSHLSRAILLGAVCCYCLAFVLAWSY